MDAFLRTRWLIGDEALEKLKQSKILVVGLGGVGGHCAEALLRAGITSLDVVDYDRVDVTNLNRQLIATQLSIGKDKASVMKERLLLILPEAEIQAYKLRLSEETIDTFDFQSYDYICDAVDQVSAKLLLAEAAQKASVPFISAMGAGNKLQPERFEIAMLSETSMCPLAKVMRKEARRRGIRDYAVVYSKEVPKKVAGVGERSPASISFVPSVSGLLMASKVVRDLVDMGK